MDIIFIHTELGTLYFEKRLRIKLYHLYRIKIGPDFFDQKFDQLELFKIFKIFQICLYLKNMTYLYAL